MRAESNDNAHNDGCVYCGLCMYGCPRGLIYNSADTLAQLSLHPNFRYEGGLTLDSAREHQGEVILNCRRESGASTSFNAQRVFIASGVLNTARIALFEGWVPNDQLTMSDSQYFLLPLLTFGRPAEDFQTDVHTLSQMFLEILDEEVSPFTVHLQLYTYSELFRESFLATAGPLKSFAKLFSTPFLSRLIMVQGYLHSSQSHRIRVQLQSDPDRTLQVSQIENPETRPTIHRLCRKLWSARRELGLVPLEPLIKYGLAGRGYHVGSSIPMSANPKPGTSDTLGRPFGLSRIHLVDASVLPTIPATTITFTVMANAHRIGTAAPRL
jgi:ferredoxin